MFNLIKQDLETKARLGGFTTAHGTVKTPTFFPVATQAAVKGVSTQDLDTIGVEGLLVNAYHLFLRPGVEVVEKCGGLHKFMNFKKTIITDSGGYQIFSLERLRKVTDEGVEFQSHVDGTAFFLTPQDVMRIQIGLGADVVVPLDECVKYPATEEQAAKSVARTYAWAKKSKEYFDNHQKNHQLFFGIVQGSVYPDLRKRSLEQIQGLGFDGICLGGLSVGEPKDLRYNMLSLIEANADKRSLRYFMGYGKPCDIIEAVSFGVDLFDCVVPTRMGRTGTAFTWAGELVVRNAPFISDTKGLDPECSCHVCRDYSRAYLRHLINVNEMLGVQLVTYHNVFWYKTFMDKIRQALDNGEFSRFKKEFLAKYAEQG